MSVVTDGRRLRYAAVGVTLIVLLLVAALSTSRISLFDGRREYRALFSDASGLVTGEEVRVAGVKVGKVTDISLDGTAVAVTFTVAGVRLGEATTAGIEIKTLLGQHYLSLDPAGDGDLPDDTIALARTSAPFDIVPALQGVATEAGAIDSAGLAKAFDAVADTLDAAAPQLSATLDGIGRLSRTIGSRDEQVQQLFSRAAQVTGVVADRDQELRELLAGTDTVLAELDRRRQVIVSLVGEVRALAKQVEGLVADNRAELAPTLRSLDRVLDVLTSNRDNIDEILKLAELYGREFVNVSGTGPWFDASIKIPRGFAVCAVDGLASPLASLLNPLLSNANQAVNGSSKPCLPLGPATVTP